MVMEGQCQVKAGTRTCVHVCMSDVCVCVCVCVCVWRSEQERRLEKDLNNLVQARHCIVRAKPDVGGIWRRSKRFSGETQTPFNVGDGTEKW